MKPPWPLLALAATLACQHSVTQLVVRVDSDLRVGDELMAVQITMWRAGTTAFVFDHTYDLRSGAYRLPGTLGVVAGDPDDPRQLEVDARAVLRDADSFDTRAVVSFQPGQTLMLDLFLASRCRDPANRAGCAVDEVCGTLGCESVNRATLPPYSGDAPRRDGGAADEDVDTDAAAPDVGDDTVDVPDPDVSDPLDAGDPDATDLDAAVFDAPDPVDAVDAAMDVGDVYDAGCGPGTTCCTGGVTCDAGSVCAADDAGGASCTSCGTSGHPCCAGNACAQYLQCLAGTCRCGGPGQPCCSGTTCGAGLTCSAGTCTGCGAVGQLCCPGNTCATAANPCAPVGCGTGGRCAVTTSNAGSCGAVLYGPWSACAFASPCAETGTQSRAVNTPTCAAGACGIVTTSQSQACARTTTGNACASTGYGAWGACGGFAGTCDTTGTQTRSVTAYQCASGACVAHPSTGSQACSRGTNGVTCAATVYGAWSACGGFTSTCDEGGTQTRGVIAYHCAAGACATTGSTETQACTRSTTNLRCSLLIGGQTCGGTCMLGVCNLTCGRPLCPC